MARKQKENEDEFSDVIDDEFSDLDDVVEKATLTRGGGGGGVKTFPLKLAEVIKAKYDMECSKPNECLIIPKDWIEEKLGMDTSKSIRGRSYQLKRKLNKQHGDIVGDGKIWHVGNIKELSYTVAVVDAKPDVETGWKNPPPRPRKTKKSEEE